MVNIRFSEPRVLGWLFSNIGNLLLQTFFYGVLLTYAAGMGFKLIFHIQIFGFEGLAHLVHGTIQIIVIVVKL